MLYYKLLLSGVIFLVLFCKPDNLEKTLSPAKHPLLDLHTKPKWEITNFSGSGPVYIYDSLIVLGAGKGLTGVTWTGDFPKKNYEISLSAMRVKGDDFFCGLTFPVRGTFCSLIVGGWGGKIVGISYVNWSDASENITTCSMVFQNNVWYHIRLQVTTETIQVWIDNELLIDLLYVNHPLSLHPFMEPVKPFGISTWKTKANIKSIFLTENIN